MKDVPVQQVVKARRDYNTWVANETLEDYALRFAPKSFRRWSAFTVANTALGGISFLALEAIGSSIAISYGFANSFWAIVIVGAIVFLAGLPIAYYAATYNIDMDLLTRGAGFGYIGSTITSLIYASFTFIFFALEAAIMAQALELYLHLPLPLGYVVCSLLIIPLVFFGVTLINRLQIWTQLPWLALMVLPYGFVLYKDPDAFSNWLNFAGTSPSGAAFQPLLFGAAATVSFSLIAQLGEQVDYLRFLPDKQNNRVSWWSAVILAGPGWIILGGAKQLGGAFLASLAIRQGVTIAKAHEPTQMYLAGFAHMFTNPDVVLAVTIAFVVLSQIKINVTNAYAGSLAWSNFFSRITHSHPGRVVWLVFNVAIALLLMELGVFETLQKVLGLYSNVAIAWVGALVADLVINKPLGISPSYIEFKRAHLYNINPVGFGSMLIASAISITAFVGILGSVAQAFSAFIALGVAFVLAPLIAIVTQGKYYIARENVYANDTSDHTIQCGVCEHEYEPQDMAYCPVYDSPICSLCCSLDARCYDACKSSATDTVVPTQPQPHNSLDLRRLVKYLGLFAIAAGLVAVIFGIVYYQQPASIPFTVLLELYAAMLIAIGIAVWWLVLTQESHQLAQDELDKQNLQLQQEINERKQLEAALQESERRFRAIFDNTFQFIGLHTPEGIVLEANQTSLDAVGVQRLDVVGRPFWETPWWIYTPEAHMPLRAAIAQAASGQFVRYEVDLRGADHTVMSFDFSYKPIFDEQGQVTMLLAEGRNITEQQAAQRDRKQAEEALRQSEELYKQILDAIPDMVLCKGAQSRILYANKAFRQYYGMSVAELRGLIDAPFSPPDYTQQYVLDDAQVFNTGQSLNIAEELIARYDGQVRLFHTIKTPIFDVAGKVVQLVAVMRDIVESKRAEEALMLYKRAVDSSSDAISLADPTGTLFYQNSAFAELFACETAEIFNQTGGIAVCYPDPEMFASMIQTVSNGQAWVGETDQVSRSGRRFPAFIRANGIKDESGKILGLVGTLTDISDRKRAEAALRESEQYNRSLFEQFPVGLALCRMDGTLIDINPAYAGILGRTIEETLALTYWDITPEKYAEQEQALLLGLSETGRYGPYEKEYIHKDGHLVPVRLTGLIIERNREPFIWSSVEDISDRKQAEEALQQKTSELEAIFEAFPDLYFRMSLDGMILDYKADTASNLYIPPEVFINKRMPELLPPKVGALFVEAIARLQQTQSLVSMEYELPMSEGSKSYEARLLPLGTNQIITIIRDINDRKRAEEALRQKAQQEQLLNQLANQIRSSLDIDEILETAVGSIRNLLQIDRCSFVRYYTDAPDPYWKSVQEASNSVLPSLLGVRIASADILPLAEKVFSKEINRVHDSRTLSDPILQQFYQSLGYCAELTLPIHTQSGDIGIACCAHTFARVWQDQEVTLLQAVGDQLAIALDQADLYKQSRLAAETAQAQAQQLEHTLQELRHTQAQLVQTEKMSSLGQLVAGVAHEVNNPVNFIHGNLTHATEYTQDLLRLVALYQQHYPTPCSEIQAEVEAIDLDFLLDDLPKLLNSMKVGTDRIRQIVLALRNFSRMDEAEKKTVDIHDGIDSTLMILQNRLNGKAEHVGIEVVKDYGNLPLVECYAGQLNQVFMNILSNAIDALDEYSERAPAAAKQQPSQIAIRTELANNQRVRIWISDNGPGMSEQTRQRLFEPFFTTKPIGKGTGLGLSISYQVVVERHGGELNCVSAPGEGAAFLIELPLAQTVLPLLHEEKQSQLNNKI